MATLDKRSISALGGIGVGLLLAAMFLLIHDDSRPPSSTGSSMARLPLGRLPGEVCEGSQAPLDSVQAAMPFSLVFPDAESANNTTLIASWKCNATQIALQYRSGVVVYESANTLKDPEQVWKRMAAEYPEFSVGNVNGVLASFADPTVGIGTTGGVDFVVNGVRVTVSGNGKILLPDLVDVADSILFPPQSSPAPNG